MARLPDDSIHKVHTRTLPPVKIARDELAQVRETYLKRYFLPPREVFVSGVQLQPRIISRRPAHLRFEDD
jgi:hypothetical protein